MKYRLIKKYPGSPKLGTFVIIQDGKIYYKNTCNLFPLNCDVRLYPEFWEPVDELEQQILKIINEQIVTQNDYSLRRYAPEYAAKQICELIKELK